MRVRGRHGLPLVLEDGPVAAFTRSAQSRGLAISGPSVKGGPCNSDAGESQRNGLRRRRRWRVAAVARRRVCGYSGPMTDRGRASQGSSPGGQRLMPIGIFSRITGLSHRALRLYADRGLLPPAHVDPDTGYRYYDVHSIRAAEMIRLLRRLDVPLGEMRLYIDAAATDRVEETLAQQRLRLEQEQARLDAALRLSAGSTSSTACSAPRRPSSWSTSRPSAACSGRGPWPGRSSTSPTSTLACILAERAEELGLTPSAREMVVLRDPTDKGLAGGDETVLRYELCLPVTGEIDRSARGRPGRTRGRPVRAQRLHRPLRGRLPLRLRATARVAGGQRPQAAGPAAHALRPGRAGHGRPGRLRH